MKQKLLALILILFLLISPTIAFADVNVDGGGGGMGEGSGESFWTPGDDGVRVTIVRIKDRKIMKNSMDFVNREQNDIDMHFNYKSKLSYRSSGLSPNVTIKYKWKKVVSPLPAIVNPSGGTNVEAIKNYFSDKNTVQYIATQMGFDYDELINGEYVLLLEPVAYFTYKGMKIAATATEAAMYDKMTNGVLKYQMQALTHQNLPLSMFLERAALGFSSWGGATTGIMANADIINCLGIAIVNFDELPEEGGVEGIPTDKDYVYRTNTEVITSVEVRAGLDDITPDDNARVTFNINGKAMSFEFVLPKGEKELAWVRWKTPTAPCEFDVSVQTTHGTIETGKISVAVVDLIEKTPPNPRGTDRNDRFTPLSYTKNFGTVNSAKWDEWWATWQPKWEWEARWGYEKVTKQVPDRWVHPFNSSIFSPTSKPGWIFEKAHEETVLEWQDNGAWVDNGTWVFDYRTYSANASAFTVQLSPDSHCLTGFKKNGKWSIKSGYGFSIDAPVRVSYSGTSLAVTPAQNAVALFPEFNYQTYNRVLVGSGDYTKNFKFKENPYSQFNSPTHFTPIWYPDGAYNVSLVAFDIWTPAGQLYVSTEAGGYIDGNVYDDWHIGPW